MNSLSWDRQDWVQEGEDWFLMDAPQMSASAASCQPTQDFGVLASASRLENEYLRVGSAENGDIVSIFDKEAQRELLKPNQVGNKLSIYEDRGDAWDFRVDYDVVPAFDFPVASSSARVDGPNAVLTQTRVFGESKLIQEIVLTAGKKTIEFRSKLDWHEDGKMLRTSFPVDVQSDSARCEIQFGNIERPTHGNTSWDWSKVEVCAHKWVDISERSYGVALLNDCRYGHRILGGNLDLNLLRSASYPDPTADRAEHEFTYALLPHVGDYVEGRVVQSAYELNVPLRRVEETAGVTAESFMRVSALGVVVEAVKKAEGTDDIIVRLYEAHGASVTASVSFGFAVQSAAVVDLMEEHPHELEVDANTVQVGFKPFEIITLKIVS